MLMGLTCHTYWTPQVEGSAWHPPSAPEKTLPLQTIPAPSLGWTLPGAVRHCNP